MYNFQRKREKNTIANTTATVTTMSTAMILLADRFSLSLSLLVLLFVPFFLDTYKMYCLKRKVERCVWSCRQIFLDEKKMWLFRGSFAMTLICHTYRKLQKQRAKKKTNKQTAPATTTNKNHFDDV